ncbi:hypothetical protein [Algoriphagus mannitolivorans]|uniref:hypothetical protein n=1 Tax=Algoriphagus mannitolivorans TaxID=226504 RepID=UPI00040D18B5|nr:hypothetical protein [Algoriphagus mannitolivorans]
MEAILLKSQTEEQINLIKEFAQKLGIEFSVINEEVLEDISLSNAIKTGKSKNYISSEDFLNELKNENSDR